MSRGGVYIEGIQVVVIAHVEPMHGAMDDKASTRSTPEEGGWPVTPDGSAPASCSRGVDAGRRGPVAVGVVQDHAKRVLLPMLHQITNISIAVVRLGEKRISCKIVFPESNRPQAVVLVEDALYSKRISSEPQTPI
jgi:hypothetical protein